MRLAAIAMILFLVGPPAFAESEGPDTPRRECNRLTSQITRYQGDVELARERGNELWEKATRDQIERLSERRASRCPQYADDGAAAALRHFAAMLGNAAKLAASYFTMGAL